MHRESPFGFVMGLAFLTVLTAASAHAFEGHIGAITSRGGPPSSLLCTVGTNCLRVEMTDTNSPNTIDILDRNTGTMTLLFPQNCCFMRLKPAAGNSSATPPGFASMPAMPMMPPGGGLELQATGEKTNLLGFACEKFEIKQRGRIMEIWATEGLLPFRNYVRNQPPRFGVRLIEERWSELLAAKKLFPLRARLRFENGPERFRFQVLSVMPQKLEPEDAQLFLLPDGYFEIRPLPF